MIVNQGLGASDGPPGHPYFLYCCVAGILIIGFKCFTTKNRAYGETLSEKENQLEQILDQEQIQNKNFLLRQIQIYQEEIGPEIKARLGTENICKYTPTCSEYARQALTEWGFLKGSYLAIIRILKCHPLTSPRVDMVPKNKKYGKQQTKSR